MPVSNDKITTTIEPNSPVVEEALSRADKKKKFISILERGIIDDRLKVDLPPHLHGQWVRKDVFSIDRLKSLGYTIDTEYAPKRALHSDGTASAQIGDVIHMICSKEDHEILEEIRNDEFVRNHGKPGQTIKSNREEKEFQAALAEATGGDIPAINESKSHAVRAAELASTMDKLKRQGG